MRRSRLKAANSELDSWLEDSTSKGEQTALLSNDYVVPGPKKNGTAADLLPFHPKHVKTSGRGGDDVSDRYDANNNEGYGMLQFSSPFAHMRSLLLAGTHTRQQRHNVATTLALITKAVTAICE